MATDTALFSNEHSWIKYLLRVKHGEGALGTEMRLDNPSALLAHYLLRKQIPIEIALQKGVYVKHYQTMLWKYRGDRHSFWEKIWESNLKDNYF